MYITILNYLDATVRIVEVAEDFDCSGYVEDNYNPEYTEYLVSDELNLSISKID